MKGRACDAALQAQVLLDTVRGVREGQGVPVPPQGRPNQNKGNPMTVNEPKPGFLDVLRNAFAEMSRLADTIQSEATQRDFALVPAPLPPTLYIAGPMTGLPEFNYPAFHEAEGHLRVAGYRTLNPAGNAKPDPETWEGYMRAAIAQLIQADGVALLPGWIDSRGARLEVGIANALSIPVWSVHAWQQNRFDVLKADALKGKR